MTRNKTQTILKPQLIEIKVKHRCGYDFTAALQVCFSLNTFIDQNTARDWADWVIITYIKPAPPTSIYNYLNGSNIYYKHFEKQILNIARLFMNLIKSDYFNTFRYTFLIVVYNIKLTCNRSITS